MLQKINKIGWIKWLLLCVLVLIVGGGAFALYQLLTVQNAPEIVVLNSPAEVEAAVQRASNFSSLSNPTNADWQPFIYSLEVDGVGVEMALVPAGCFMMGSDEINDAQPVFEVCFDVPFLIDRFEVTNAQFSALGGQADAVSVQTGDAYPRVNVTWYEAEAYCREVRGGWLPPEGYWEYAARGPSALRYPWGEQDPTADRAIFNEPNGVAPVGVDRRPAGQSWVGAYDLAGNALEWTNTVDTPDYSVSGYDPKALISDTQNSERRVVRGGSFGFRIDFLHAATRFSSGPGDESIERSFRCVSSLP